MGESFEMYCTTENSPGFPTLSLFSPSHFSCPASEKIPAGDGWARTFSRCKKKRKPPLPQHDSVSHPVIQPSSDLTNATTSSPYTITHIRDRIDTYMIDELYIPIDIFTATGRLSIHHRLRDWLLFGFQETFGWKIILKINQQNICNLINIQTYENELDFSKN